MDMQMCSKDSNTLFPLISQSIGQTGHADMQFIAYWGIHFKYSYEVAGYSANQREKPEKSQPIKGKPKVM